MNVCTRYFSLKYQPVLLPAKLTALKALNNGSAAAIVRARGCNSQAASQIRDPRSYDPVKTTCWRRRMTLGCARQSQGPRPNPTYPRWDARY